MANHKTYMRQALLEAEKALAEVAQAITAADRHIQLHVARQDCCSDLLVLR